MEQSVNTESMYQNDYLNFLSNLRRVSYDVSEQQNDSLSSKILKDITDRYFHRSSNSSNDFCWHVSDDSSDTNSSYVDTLILRFFRFYNPKKRFFNCY